MWKTETKFKNGRRREKHGGKKCNENDIKIIGERKERGKGGREEGNRKEEKEQKKQQKLLSSESKQKILHPKTSKGAIRSH